MGIICNSQAMNKYVNKNTGGNFQNQVHSLIFVGIEEPFL